MTNELHKAAIKLGRAVLRMPALAPVPQVRRLGPRPWQVAVEGQSGVGRFLTAGHTAGWRGVPRPFLQQAFRQPLRYGRMMARVSPAAGRSAAVAPRGSMALAGARLALPAKAFKKTHALQRAVRMAGPVTSVRRYLDGATGINRLMKLQKHNFYRMVYRSTAAPVAVSRYRAARSVAMGLQSLAPIGPASRGLLPQLKPARGHLTAAEEYRQPQPEAAEAGRSAMMREVELARDLENLLARQARLPPRGMTGFDPRLTPAWAGLKLPN